VRPTFLVSAPSYTHKSGGVRALYRLCHHLNAAGYHAAIAPWVGHTAGKNDWLAPEHRGPVDESIVIYPEVVGGNPLGADRVVRWALNNPGLLAGDRVFPDSEMVFTYNPARLALVSESVSKPLGAARVLYVPLVDPTYIYPDSRVQKTMDCFFTHKGVALRAARPLPNESDLQALEAVTPTMADLGAVLRRTRTLYSYDHASTVLKEAAVSGCRVQVVHEDGRLLDPEQCGCAHNVHWERGLRRRYARAFEDSRFVDAFVQEVRTRWEVPGPTRPPKRARPARTPWELATAVARLLRRLRGLVDQSPARRAEPERGGEPGSQRLAGGTGGDRLHEDHPPRHLEIG
jgi:hypothetical protein